MNVQMYLIIPISELLPNKTLELRLSLFSLPSILPDLC